MGLTDVPLVFIHCECKYKFVTKDALCIHISCVVMTKVC